MSKVRVLCEADREMMLDFSGRCVARLNSHAPLKLFLAPFHGLLDANVLKEIEKDRLVMEQAAAAFLGGNSKSSISLEDLFESTRQIDAEFIKKFSSPVLTLRIRHDDFSDVRKKRITAFIEMVYALLGNWQEGSLFPQVLQQTYTEEGYRTVLAEILHLYNVETKLLGNSLTGRGPAALMTGIFADKLFRIMEGLAQEIARDYACRAFAAAASCAAAAGPQSFGAPL